MYIYIYDYINIYIWLYACICIWSPTPMAHHFSPGGGRDNASPWIILKRLARQLALLPMSIQWANGNPAWFLLVDLAKKTECLFSESFWHRWNLFIQTVWWKIHHQNGKFMQICWIKKHIKHHKTMCLTDFRWIFPPQLIVVPGLRPGDRGRPDLLHFGRIGRQSRGIPGYPWVQMQMESNGSSSPNYGKPMKTQRFWASLTHPTGSDTFEFWSQPQEVNLTDIGGLNSAKEERLLGEMAGSESSIQSWCLHVMTSSRFSLMCV